ncbi:MAG: hypothetical protein ACR2JC_03450 [Chloroflexota bacterium]
MNLVFERGDRSKPCGHALLYFQSDGGSIMATYVTVPPIKFDLSKFVPEMLASMFQGMDLSMGNEVMAPPVPPIPEEVPNRDYLGALADRRQDDLVYCGGIVTGDPMRLLAETQEAARSYGELYAAAAGPDPASFVTTTVPDDVGNERVAAMTEQERLNELTMLTGRLRDSLHSGEPDPELEQEMHQIAGFLPAKYRPHALVRAAVTPGEQGQRLAQLYLERSYKLFNEDYLDLERIDREIDAIDP